MGELGEILISESSQDAVEACASADAALQRAEAARAASGASGEERVRDKCCFAEADAATAQCDFDKAFDDCSSHTDHSVFSRLSPSTHTKF